MKSIDIRRSVRSFKKDKVEEHKIEQLLRAAMQAPSAKNQQPWHFVVVDERNILNQLKDAAPGGWMLEHAPLGICVCYDNQTLKTEPMVPQDLSAAVQNILLECVEQSLGSVWIGTYPHPERMEVVSNVLEFKDNIIPFALIAIGYPSDDAKGNYFADRYDPTRVHKNKW